MSARVMVTIEGTTALTPERFALVMADEFDEHGYMTADTVTVQYEGEKPVTYLLDGGDK